MIARATMPRAWIKSGAMRGCLRCPRTMTDCIAQELRATTLLSRALANATCTCRLSPQMAPRVIYREGGGSRMYVKALARCWIPPAALQVSSRLGHAENPECRGFVHDTQD